MGRPSHMLQLADELARYRIVDVHQHLGSSATVGAYDEPTVDSARDVDARFALMTGYGIDLALVHPNHMTGSDPATVAKRNDSALAATRAHKDRFVAALAALPLTEVAHVEAEWQRIRGAGFRGLTLHTRFAAKPINTPLMDDICERAEAQGWPVAMHAFAESGFESLWRLDDVARRFPRVRFLALSALSTFDQSRQAVEIGARQENISFDTALMGPVASVLTELCDRVGADRLLFGTDLYMIPKQIYACPSTLFEIAATALPDGAKERILGKNALELFGLPVG